MRQKWNFSKLYVVSKQNIWLKMYTFIYQLALDTVMWESFHLLSLVALSLLLHLAEFFLIKKKKDNGTLHFSLIIYLCMKRGGEQVLNANSHRPCLEESYFLLNA